MEELEGSERRSFGPCSPTSLAPESRRNSIFHWMVLQQTLVTKGFVHAAQDPGMPRSPQLGLLTTGASFPHPQKLGLHSPSPSY